jgi:putative ABC transport system substrate-binding protein
VKRIVAVLTLGAWLFALSCPLGAQQPTKIPRIGYLKVGGPLSARDEAFLRGLRELGYIDGKNIMIESRGDPQRREDRLPDLAAELVQLKVDIIVALDPPSARAAKKATSSIPIIMRAYADPVTEGLVSSLARPGGNITGVYSESDELLPKRLELMKETKPRLVRVAVLQNPDFANTARAYRELEASAKLLGLRLQALNVQAAGDFEPAFRTAAANQSHALMTIRTPLIVFERERIAGLAIKNKLPAIYDDRQFVEAGGLMSYGANLQDLYKRAATYVDKILKGTKPADLPVEQPKKFELIINLKAAKQIGLTIPPNVLARADRVIK